MNLSNETREHRFSFSKLKPSVTKLVKSYENEISRYWCFAFTLLIIINNIQKYNKQVNKYITTNTTIINVNNDVFSISFREGKVMNSRLEEHSAD